MNLRRIAQSIFLVSLIVGLVVLRVLFGPQKSLWQNAPLVLNRETILFTLGMIVSFMIYQYLILSGEAQKRDSQALFSMLLIYFGTTFFFWKSIKIMATIMVTAMVFVYVEMLVCRHLSSRVNNSS